MAEDGSGELTTRHSIAVKSAARKLLEPIQHRDNHLPERILGLNQIMPQPVDSKSTYHSYSQYYTYSDCSNPVHEPDHDLAFY